MPDTQDPSPVAPSPGSRLWTAGASGGLAVLILLALAVYDPEHAPPLLAGALLVALSTWMVARQRPVSGQGETAPVTDSRTDARAEGQATLLEEVFETVTDPMMVVRGGEPDDMAGRRILLANRAARDLLRIPREGAILVSALRDPGLLEAVDEALFGGVSRETDFDSGGVQARHWRAVTRPLPGSDAQTLALVMLRDETDVRRMELMRVDFLANASHELRTPLASLSGFIETLKGHAREDSVARDRFLDIMAAQAERMTRLVADLLSLSRIELNEHVPPSGHLDLGRATADVVDALSVLTHDHGVKIVVDAPDEAVRIKGERDEIVQVIQNLVDNAIKYSPRDGRIEVEIRSGLTPAAAAAARMPGAARLPLLTPDRDDGLTYAAVTVRDHGPGLSREHLPRLTERFYRVEGQKSGGDRPGTGLGLAIVKHIVNRHRGGLLVESLPGEGAAFTAFFPLSKRPLTTPTPTV
ncbi:MAG: ATP-binding protein [Brevundimonas sp.]|jgi:two-component system, OmpR family, phosphate regulon sensor histidine kinase PhoR|uniref:sensor histidine kinase n=1 Tax=Brevundimonas sp. TaxID=1871086 RepID=UPI00300197E7